MKRRRPPTEVQNDLFHQAPSLFRRSFPPGEATAPSSTPTSESVDAEDAVTDDEPENLATYTVHCYVTVCVKLTGIMAGSHREAAKLAQERFDWNSHDGEVEFVDELHEMLVDVEGDEDYSRSVAFRADLEPVQ